MSAHQSCDSMGRLRPKAESQRWTLPEIERAIALRREGYTRASIGAMITEEFGTPRSANSVIGMLKTLASRGEDFAPASRSVVSLAAHARKREIRIERVANLSNRPCLCCKRVFGSEGNHNRICSPCKGSETWQGVPS